MHWFIHLLQTYPELAIFLTLGIGFWVGRLHVGKFSLGVVTSVLLVGVLIGQMDIHIPGPIKSAFFLLFLFAVGYSVGPQFFRGLKKEGLPQMGFAVLMLLFCLLVPYACAKVMGYDMGQAAGLLSGSQTISAVIGVAGDTISNLDLPPADKDRMINFIPIGYAVTYLFGTAGSAWILASIGPALLGGLEKVRQQCRELEATLGAAHADDPSMVPGYRPIMARAYTLDNTWFDGRKNVRDLELHFHDNGQRIFVVKVRQHGQLLDPTPGLPLTNGDEVILSGRREFLLQIAPWLGREMVDNDLGAYSAELLPVVLSGNKWHTMPVKELREQPFMQGVFIRAIKRASIELPVTDTLQLEAGDEVTLVGLKADVDAASANIGFADRPSTEADMIFIGLGIFIGGIIGSLTLLIKGVPLSLSTSGGALIAGLVMGWLRSRRPTYGYIPGPILWFMNNVGLNLFIAIVGITAGPGFVQGFKEVGWSLFLVGAIATTVPLVVGLLLGRYVFKFHPAINLGCNAGARTTTAALGAIQEALQSKTPALGYTVTYAVGNTLLIIWGVVIVLLMR